MQAALQCAVMIWLFGIHGDHIVTRVKEYMEDENECALYDSARNIVILVA